jgi:ubiquitin-protein ligase
MYSYLSENIKNNYYNKLSYILKKKNINYEFSNGYANFYKKNNGFNFSVYHDSKNKPEFIVNNENNLNNSNVQDNNENSSISENINLNIDDYELIEDIIYEIEKIKSKIEIKILENKNNLELEKLKNKNIENFLSLLENKKNELLENKKNEPSNQNEKTKPSNQNKLSNKNKFTNENLFSTRACVEMLGDQVLKIQLTDNFNVDINDFPNIKISMDNFSFKGSSNLVVQIQMELDLNILSNAPKIKITSNKILKDDILKIICELKPFTDINSWSVKYSIYDSVINIYNMINTYGETDLEFPSEIDQIINDLEYLLSIRENNISQDKLLKIFDKDFDKNFKSKMNKNSSIDNKWKKGTGYGHDGLVKWDIDAYVKCINEKKNKISTMFDIFISKLSDDYANFSKFENLNRVNKIIKLLVNYLENEEINNKNILLILNVIFKNIDFIKDLDKTNSNIKFIKLIDLLKNYSDDNSIEHGLFNNEKILNVSILNKKESSDPYSNIFDSQSFMMYPSEFKTFHYKNLSNINSEKILKIKKEINIIKKSITNNSEASIFFWVEKNNLNKMKFIITGPANTPYDQGLYIFDMTLPSEYPTKPPFVHFSNNGSQRFNPNLYNCGKVCLSLLGTWRGEKGESWNSHTSTFFQILVSIQSQILIEEPYFNEPGYESFIGKTQGISNSKSYNDSIRKYNLDHAMNGLLEGILNKNSSYPEFDYIIRNYFKFKKDKIINILNKWESEYTSNEIKNKFNISKEKFINLVNQL